jgi:hypothetical protein
MPRPAGLSQYRRAQNLQDLIVREALRPAVAAAQRVLRLR